MIRRRFTPNFFLLLKLNYVQISEILFYNYLINFSHTFSYIFLFSSRSKKKSIKNTINNFLGLIGQQLQKQRIFNKFDQIGSHNSSNMLMNPNNNPQQQQNRIHNQYPQNAPVDDDLGTYLLLYSLY